MNENLGPSSGREQGLNVDFRVIAEVIEWMKEAGKRGERRGLRHGLPGIAKSRGSQWSH